MIDKTVGSAAEAVADIPDGASLAVGGFGLSGNPDRADRGAARAGHDRPQHRQQQLRRRRLGSRHPAERQAHPQDDLVVRRREQGVRAPVPLGRARARAHAAGHARREAARRRIGHRRVLHADRRRHPGRRGRSAAPVRRAGRHRGRVAGEGRPHLRRGRHDARVRARGGDRHRLRARARAQGRPARQPGLQQGGPQLQPARRDGRADLHRPGRGARRARRARPGSASICRASTSTASSRSAPDIEKRIERRTVSVRRRRPRHAGRS